MYKNLKALREKKNNLVEKMTALSDKAANETRAFTEEETQEYDRLAEEIRGLADTIKKAEEAYDNSIKNDPEKKEQKDKFENEKRAFCDFIKGLELTEEVRSDVNWTVGDNGAVIPTSVANYILEEVKERCNIWNYATKFVAGGTLTFPKYDESEQQITMAYADEFGKLTSTSGKFTSVSMTGFLAASLTKVSISLINNSQVDLFTYVCGKMADTIANWIEKELLKGTDSKIEGLSKVEVVSTELTADSLIDLQDSVKTVFQKNAKFIMNSKTKNFIRKLKDGQDNYLVVTDYVKGVANGYTLLGKPVELSDQLEDGEVLYGDYSGLFVKIAESPSVNVYKEKYTEEHAVGVMVWLEMDAKLIEPQKVKKIKATTINTISKSTKSTVK